MNSCILMAQIIQEPQLRYTTEQLALAEMLVQFSGLRAEDPPATLKVVGWGNLAQEIQQNYHQGDHVILEGRLGMNTVQLEGFKEKRAELTVQRIHPLGDGVSIGAAPERETPATSPAPPVATSNSGVVGSGDLRTPDAQKASAVGVIPQSDPDETVPQSPKPQPAYSIPANEADVDDIPF